jgi:hypothetical protein
MNIRQPGMYNQLPLQSQPGMYTSYTNQLPLAVPVPQLPLALPVSQNSTQSNTLSTILPILLNISNILEKLETRIENIEKRKKHNSKSESPPQQSDSDSETRGVIGDIKKLMGYNY